MTNQQTDLTPSGELLYCAKERGSSRLSGTLTLRELFQELESLLPVDILYVQIPLPDGSIALREVGSIRVDFFPVDTSPNFVRESISGIAGQETDIASAPLVVPTLPQPQAPRMPKVKPKKAPPSPSPKPPPKKATKANLEPQEAPSHAVSLQSGSLVIKEVTPCPPGKEKDYSKFGSNGHRRF